MTTPFDTLTWELNTSGQLTPDPNPQINPSSTSPTAPTLTAVVAGDGTLALTVAPASGYESMPIHAYVWQVGGLVSVSTENRVGAGTLTLTGLTNGTVYGVQAIHKNADLLGAPSKVFFGSPTDGTFGPVGPMSKPLDSLADMLANTSAWQSLTGTLDSVSARDKIHLEAFNGSVADIGNADYAGEVTAARPFAIVSQGEDYNRNSIGLATGLDAGQAILEIEAGTPAEYQTSDKYSEAKVWFQNHLGQIISDVFALSDTGIYPHISSIELAGGPERTSYEEAAAEGDAMWVGLAITWGYGGAG